MQIKKSLSKFFGYFSIGLILVIILGFVLRVIGINYGLPLYLVNDEPVLVSSVLALKDNLNPGHFDWPHLYFYINGIGYGLFVFLRAVIGSIVNLPEVYYSVSSYFMVSRLISIFFGVSTIVAVYFLTLEIYKDKKVATLAALILAILPIHVIESHTAKPDTAQTFLTALALIFIYRIYENGKRKDYILSGIIIGLATSIKYGGFLLFFPLLIAHCLRYRKLNEIFKWSNFKNIVYSGLISVVSFYVGTPFATVDYKKFFSNETAVGALWQIQNVGSVEWSRYPAELYETFVPMYHDNLGIVLWGIFLLLIAVFMFFNRRDDKSVLLLTPLVIFLFYISKFDRSPSHYFLFLIPFYVPVLAKFIFELWGWIVSKIKFLSHPYLFYVFVAILLLPTFFSSAHSAYLFARVDTRLMAYKWVKANLVEERDFIYVVGENLENVPFQVNNTEKIKKLDRSNIKTGAPFYVVVGMDGLTEEQLTQGDRDPDILKGNSSPILKDADLLFSQNDKLRLGPPIFIFKVNSVEQN